MYALVFILIMGASERVHVVPIVFNDLSSCEEARMEHIKRLDEAKPEGASHVSQCVNMRFSHAAAPLEAALLRAENESDSAPQDDPHDAMWYEK
jgi:hypothetical protein